jgi:dienelactone hydrolase/pimeloyl-ACP methyl ester carboxylesterase
VNRDVYTIEKVIFESRPGFRVTANLYIPKGRTGRMPAVIGTCGHGGPSAKGKSAAPYQSFAQGLARHGYVVLIFDPICQGERRQYPEGDSRTSRHSAVGGHLYAGNQQFLVGESVASWFVWDGIRALDYLLSRPEVDPRHVGVTGNSGGGMMTTWLCGADQRFTMAAPSCFMTTFRRNMENEEPTDTEQCPERVLALGLDYADFIAALAPKPVILLGKEKDFFDVRGLEEAFARLQRLYSLLGAEENIRLFVGSDYHEYSQDNREAMYGWFNRQTGLSANHAEPALTLEEDATLSRMPPGQVSGEPAQTVFSFTSERSRALAARRRSLEGPALQQAVIDALKLPPREGVSDYRILRNMRNRGYPKKFAVPYAIETEPGIFPLVYRLSDTLLLSRPPRGSNRALLYVSHRSADDELRKEPLIAESIQAEPRSAVFTCDLRGIGESQPNTTHRDFLHPYGSDYFYAIYGAMFNYPYVGQRTYDLLRVIDWLGATGHEEIHLVAKGWGTIPATFAALLTDRVSQITLKNALASYAAVAESENYGWPLSSFVPGVLKSFDLPDCYRALAGKKLRQLETWGAIPL